MTAKHHKTTKLSDTQLILLSTASQRPDHRVIASDAITESAFVRAVKGLARAGLVSRLEPDADGFSNDELQSADPLYAITSAGLEAIGVGEQEPQVEAGLRDGE